MTTTTFWCEHAWLPGGVAAGVRVDVDGGDITAVRQGAAKAGTVLPGLTVPGMANCHSHAFHRALRGHTHGGGGTFWTWRERMYAVAAKLDPDSYHRLARAVYGEMVLAGYTSVGEFHYLHHGAGGKPYGDANAMGHALVNAAADAGIRLTLLDTCYLAGGFCLPPGEVQQRFSDGDADSWAQRASALRPCGDVVLGAAVHSVRAVPAAQLPVVAAWAAGHAAPLHVHLSEQRRENQDCIDHCGRTPTGLLSDRGVLGERTVAVHATHLTGGDVDLLAASGARACLCPTTERDLADGIGPAGALRDAGVPLCLGSDSHAVIDPLAELRALEMNERLATERRGRFTPDELLAAATGHAALGRPAAGRIAPGAPADLVTIDSGSPRTAGAPASGVPMAATAADVRQVIIGGRYVVRDGRHETLGDVASLLAGEIRELWT